MLLKTRTLSLFLLIMSDSQNSRVSSLLISSLAFFFFFLKMQLLLTALPVSQRALVVISGVLLVSWKDAHSCSKNLIFQESDSETPPSWGMWVNSC